MSLDNDFDYRKKLRDTRELLVAAVHEKSDRVLSLVDLLEDVDHSAFSGGYNERYYDEGHEKIGSIRRAVDDGVLACDDQRMHTALNRAEQLLDKYKAENSFAAHADDESVDVDGDLSF